MAMSITANSARAYHGLQATAEPTSEGTSGTITIGQGQTVTTLADATSAIVFAVEVDSTYTVAINLSTLVPTLTGAGVNQVETATAAGTITASGNATVIVTGDDITGSPLTVSVAVANTDTAATWAGKVRTELNATAAITSLYTVGGASTAITLTRIADRYNDSTLNISLANGTCTGITTAATSADTTAGINPAKCWRISGTTYAGEDFEGADLPNPFVFCGIQVRSTAGEGGGTFLIDSGSFQDRLIVGETFQKSNATGIDSIEPSNSLTITGESSYQKAIVTLIYY